MIETMLAQISHYMAQGNILAYVLVYCAGFLSSLTPCVYPIIPLTVAYFASQGEQSKVHTLILALFYVLGMSLVYSILGMIAALTGSLFGNIATHPITLLLFANVCILFGLYMMEVFDIPLPGFLTARSGIQRKGYIGSFLLGCSVGMVVGPCTTPVLAILLAYVGTQQGIIFGSTLLFTFSFGMGTLLILIAVFSGLIQRLPKSGVWMVRVKKATGIIMIGLGEYFLVRAGKGMF